MALTDTSQKFVDIYVNNEWDEGSGPGSAPHRNIAYRTFIENFMLNNDVKHVLDFGCGDWQFTRYVNLSRVK